MTTELGGPPAIVLSEEDVARVEKMAAVLTQAQIADYFGFTEKTLRNIMKRQPEVRTAYNRGKAISVMNVANNLVVKALDGDINAAKFYLSHQAGWSEKTRTEITGADGEDLKWTIEVIKP
jgi:predicted transcriptional regulator